MIETKIAVENRIDVLEPIKNQCFNIGNVLRKLTMSSNILRVIGLLTLYSLIGKLS